MSFLQSLYKFLLLQSVVLWYHTVKTNCSNSFSFLFLIYCSPCGCQHFHLNIVSLSSKCNLSRDKSNDFYFLCKLYLAWLWKMLNQSDLVYPHCLSVVPCCLQVHKQCSQHSTTSMATQIRRCKACCEWECKWNHYSRTCKAIRISASRSWQ